MSEEKSSGDNTHWSVFGAIAVAVVAAIASVTVGYWQYNAKVLEPKETAEMSEFRGRVVDADSENGLRKVKIILEAKGAPPIIYSDSEGYFVFPLNHINNQIRIRVNAEGYEKYDRFITPSSSLSIEEIRIYPTPSFHESPHPDPTPEVFKTSEQSLQPINLRQEEPTALEYNMIAGDWVMVENVKPEDGGYNIIWSYNATLQNGILTMRGRKTQVNNKEPTWGEKKALSIFRLTLDGFKAKGKFEEEDYKHEILQGNVEIIFDADLLSLRGSVLREGKEIATFTGSKQE
jgi:hypothetical protein